MSESVIPSIAKGRPVKPEVDKLLKKYAGVPRDGRVITHDEISATIGIEPEKDGKRFGHYNAVIQSWRKKMRNEYGVILDGRSAVGEGYRVLRADDMVKHGESEHRAAYRKVGRAVQAAALAPDNELDEIGRMRRDHALLHMQTSLRSMKGSNKALAAPPKLPSLKDGS